MCLWADLKTQETARSAYIWTTKHLVSEIKKTIDSIFEEATRLQGRWSYGCSWAAAAWGTSWPPSCRCRRSASRRCTPPRPRAEAPVLRISPHVNCCSTSSSPWDRCSVLVRGDSGDCTLSELLNGDLFTFSENLSVACCCSDTWDSEHFSSLVDSETHIVCISELFVQIVPSY